MAKYRKFDPKNKKQSKDKRAKNGRDQRIHDVSGTSRVKRTDLNRFVDQFNNAEYS